VIERIVEEAEDDPELMTYFERSGLVPRAVLDVVEHSPAAGLVTVEHDGQRTALGLGAAVNIRVVDESHADSLPSLPKRLANTEDAATRGSIVGLLAGQG